MRICRQILWQNSSVRAASGNCDLRVFYLVGKYCTFSALSYLLITVKEVTAVCTWVCWKKIFLLPSTVEFLMHFTIGHTACAVFLLQWILHYYLQSEINATGKNGSASSTQGVNKHNLYIFAILGFNEPWHKFEFTFSEVATGSLLRMQYRSEKFFILRIFFRAN